MSVLNSPPRAARRLGILWICPANAQRHPLARPTSPSTTRWEKLVQAGCTEGDEDENETVELMAARLLKAHKEDVWGANRAGADGVVLGA